MWTVGLVGHQWVPWRNLPTRNVYHFLGDGLRGKRRQPAASPPGNSHTSNLPRPNFDGQCAQYQTELIGSPLGPKNEL